MQLTCLHTAGLAYQYVSITILRCAEHLKAIRERFAKFHDTATVRDNLSTDVTRTPHFKKLSFYRLQYCSLLCFIACESNSSHENNT